MIVSKLLTGTVHISEKLDFDWLIMDFCIATVLPIKNVLLKKVWSCIDPTPRTKNDFKETFKEKVTPLTCH